MNTQHTPGPWRYDREKSRIVSESAFEDWSLDKDVSDEPVPISVVDLMGAMGGADTQADARLIAAAPDLLAALEEAGSIIDALWSNSAARSEYGWDKSDGASFEKIRAAICRATGTPT